VRDAGEQCDDGNTTNIDGCDSVCKFEQLHRANYLKMQWTTDMYCTANRLGAAVSGSSAQGQLQTSLDDGITDGSISIIFKSLGLDDLTGTTAPSFNLGVMNGAPFMAPMGVTYDGNLSPDWWYTIDPVGLDALRNPTAILPGSIAAKLLNAGPGTVRMNVTFAGSPAVLKLTETKLTVLIGAPNTPLASTTGNTPGHIAAENLDPSIQSFATAGQKTTNGAGKLCGNVSAASLAQVPIPAALAQGGGFTACQQNYPVTASLLDVIIGGCNIFLVGQQITPSQPDKVDPAAPPAGAGGLYTLQATNSTTKSVNQCRDNTGTIVNLATCLEAAAYSAYFKFATNRVIGK